MTMKKNMTMTRRNPEKEWLDGRTRASIPSPRSGGRAACFAVPRKPELVRSDIFIQELGAGGTVELIQ